MTVTKLDAYESALFCVGMARDNLRGKVDLRSQLADLRLKAAMEALEGNVDMQEFERKVLGQDGCIICGRRLREHSEDEKMKCAEKL